jgi:hypothetical protein
VDGGLGANNGELVALSELIISRFMLNTIFECQTVSY